MGKVLRPLLIIIALFTIAADFPAPSGMVNDFAGILSSSFRTNLEYQLREIKAETGIELSVAIINTTEGVSIEDYANRLFEKWGIGSKDKNNGVLLLIIPNQKLIRIEVGYGLEGDINDAMAGRIIRDKIVPYFKENKFEEGVLSGINAIITAVVNPEELEKQLSKNEELDTKTKLFGLLMAILFVFMLIKYPRLLLFIMMFSGRGGGSSFGGRGGFGSGFGGFGGGLSGGGGASGRW